MEERAQVPVGPPVANPLPSYWHNPKSPLANVIEPETDKPAEPYDYAIIGSGICGTMVAYYALQTHPGARVVMFEAREVCSGATGRNGGHTKAASYRSYLQHMQALGQDEALRIARMEYANILETHRLARELNVDCESAICDTVDLIYDQQTFDSGKEAVEKLRADATEEERETGKMAWYQIEEMNEDVARSLHVPCPNLKTQRPNDERLVGVIRYLAGRIHAYRFTTGILKECVKKGLQLCTMTPVHSLQPSLHGSDMWDVFTQYNKITAHKVILATNGYTPCLLKSLQGAIVPLRGQITAQQAGKNSRLANPLPTTYSFIYRNGYEYMIPRPLTEGRQHIVIGGGLGRLPQAGATEFGVVDDGSLNPQVSQYLRESLVEYFGAENWGETSEEEASHRVVQEWTGIMGATADGRPFVGEVPGNKGMWISAGFNGHGMVLCLKSAEALVAMMDGGSHSQRPMWFPESLLVTQERLDKCKFRGRMDMQTSE